MSRTELISPHDAILLDDSIVHALERAGLWRRAASRWLVILDSLATDPAREYVALRREACLLMTQDNVTGGAGDKRRKSYRLLKETQCT